MPTASRGTVLTLADIASDAPAALLWRYGLDFQPVANAQTIPGTYWGEPEAGIVGRTVYARGDTPVHSLLHESGHVICMTGARRDLLDRDAGGDDLEESAVCYLQVLLADYLEGVGRQRLMRDMDTWGYSFRLGSTRHWFEQDATDARQFLINHRLIWADSEPTFRLRR
jgi:hypothetical protein